jgi:xylulokinase
VPARPGQRARAPIFLPYLSGERTPHNNPHASGTFIGLRSEHTAADLGYAVMEGVCFGLMDGQAAMARDTRPDAGPGQALSLVGGGARSDVWGQMLASGLNCPLQRPIGAHAAAALGAARLAWLADGGSEAQVCVPLPASNTFGPDADQRAHLLARYKRFRALYPVLRDLF